MADFDLTAPVIVAVGEVSRTSLAAPWPSPVTLAGAAITAALSDSGQAAALADAVDCVVAIRTFEDSGLPMGTGSPDNVPAVYAAQGGVSAPHYVYADVGGQSPQAVVNEFAGALRRGEYRAVLIAGAEAIGTAKRVRKEGRKLDWHIASDLLFDDRLSSYPILSRAEIRHGILSMPLAYSMIETARRSRLGMDVNEYSAEMARLWSALASKSLTRDHAQFAKEWSADALLDEADGNYHLTHMYRRWMVAQDGVDLGGALIMTTAGTAQEMGIHPDKWVWLTGAAEAAEPPLSERVNISGSDAQVYAVNAALEQAGLCAEDLGPVDIYSCFPCAVFAAADTMHMPARALQDYSLTGGLTFFGGPGNGYSVHAIAAMVQALRIDGSKPAMITANGGVMTKQAVGIYAKQQPEQAWPGAAQKGYEAKCADINHAPAGRGKILTYARGVVKGEAGAAALLLEMEQGYRALAMLDGAILDAAILDRTSGADLLDEIVQVCPGEKRHIAVLA
jgi:acetyl-CoA C-acetyltransferase